MGLQFFVRVLATAFLAIPSVQASPYFSSLNARDLFVPSTTCDNFVVGATGTVLGQVCISVLDGILTVKYPPILPSTYTEVHVYVGTTAPTNRAPGSFPYSSAPGGACSLAADNSTATCTIPVQPSWRVCGQTLYIATHAAIASPGTTGQTAWGAGTCFGGTGGNCAKYWTFQTQCFCRSTSIVPPVTYTSTSVTTITSTSTTEYLTSTTSVTTYTVTSSSVVQFSTTSYDTITSTSSSILFSTSTPEPITTTVSCLNPSA
ncbi:hypothetical protein ONS95_013656 [Cadophora gregata]|uniref:uncharacterized protein n=1 Tax=Cadophora gregata TaxID=51156 RepID=UPI0026DBE795|nr:uncharacterized protein ONS95_013656 [Cadophora gregata]KAK0114154.1 hypothetical protein ONS95_013656 [Cadophora gregata]